MSSPIFKLIGRHCVGYCSTPVEFSPPDVAVTTRGHANAHIRSIRHRRITNSVRCGHRNHPNAAPNSVVLDRIRDTKIGHGRRQFRGRRPVKPTASTSYGAGDGNRPNPNEPNKGVTTRFSLQLESNGVKSTSPVRAVVSMGRRNTQVEPDLH